MKEQAKKARHLPDKYIYIAFLAATILFIFRSDFSTAIIFGGIGLAFDPFTQSVTFSERPLWQRAWLVLHIAMVMLVIVLALMK